MLIVSLFRLCSSILRLSKKDVFSYSFTRSNKPVAQWEKLHMCMSGAFCVGDLVAIELEDDIEDYGIIINIYKKNNGKGKGSIKVAIAWLYSEEELKKFGGKARGDLRVPSGTSCVLTNHFQLFNLGSLVEAQDRLEKCPVLYPIESFTRPQQLLSSGSPSIHGPAELQVLDTTAGILKPLVSNFPYMSDLCRAVTRPSMNFQELPADIWVNILSFITDGPTPTIADVPWLVREYSGILMASRFLRDTTIKDIAARYPLGRYFEEQREEIQNAPHDGAKDVDWGSALTSTLMKHAKHIHFIVTLTPSGEHGDNDRRDMLNSIRANLDQCQVINYVDISIRWERVDLFDLQYLALDVQLPVRDADHAYKAVDYCVDNADDVGEEYIQRDVLAEDF